MTFHDDQASSYHVGNSVLMAREFSNCSSDVHIDNFYGKIIQSNSH